MSDQLTQTSATEKEISRQLLRVFAIFGMFDLPDDKGTPVRDEDDNKKPLNRCDERRTA